MWMTTYMLYVKRGFRDQHGIDPTGGTDIEPLFNSLPDGTYPMLIAGKLDLVRVENQRISCCNFPDSYTFTQRGGV